MFMWYPWWVSTVMLFGMVMTAVKLYQLFLGMQSQRRSAHQRAVYAATVVVGISAAIFYAPYAWYSETMRHLIQGIYFLYFGVALFYIARFLARTFASP